MKIHWGTLFIGIGLGMFGVPMLQQLLAKAKTQTKGG